MQIHTQQMISNRFSVQIKSVQCTSLVHFEYIQLWKLLIIFVKQKNVLLAQAFNSMYQHSQGELAYVLYYSFRNITTRVYTADIYV